MSPNSLFKIIVRVLGLFLLFETITGLAGIASMFLFVGSDNRTAIVCVIISLIFLVWLIRVLLIKPDAVINIFRLDSGFLESDWDIRFSETQILRAAVVLIGGNHLLTILYSFIENLLFYFKKDSVQLGHRDTSRLTTDVLMMTLCLLLIGYNKEITNYIQKGKWSNDSLLLSATDVEDKLLEEQKGDSNSSV